ncbi:threonine/serine ThrE exporter family protein [Natranaerobius trueperi]|uniref:Threonine/serine exporter-like N-terminal domain-containing protein n=1 Tax=Natranaerobius trueperi TaxID=759412 RepID=A0A226BV42_9FIRM|nr:threonine/serine exporter family protein [Natranaerobius trueperi]OWZ82908.1 hypothetical protein CDO51_11540 [Natranaerobius trueperi]
MYTEDEILILAGNAAEIMLANGGETYRVEQMVEYMCKSAGIKFVEPYATPTGIFISVNNVDEPPETTIRRVRSRTIDLDKVSRINELSRRIASHEISYQKAQKELKSIAKEGKTFGFWPTIWGACMISASSAMFFGGHWIDILPSFIISFIIQITINYMDIRDIYFFSDFLAGLIGGLVGSAFINLGFGTSLDVLTVSALMPLVPGVAITNGVRDIIKGDLNSGMVRVFAAIWVAVAIASGVVASFYIVGGGQF